MDTNIIKSSVMDCPFCKIVSREDPAEIVQEKEDFIAFENVWDQAPHHYIVAPKAHMLQMSLLADTELMGRLSWFLVKLIRQKGLEDFRIVMNVGDEAFQTIEHAHIQIASGKKMSNEFFKDKGKGNGKS